MEHAMEEGDGSELTSSVMETEGLYFTWKNILLDAGQRFNVITEERLTAASTPNRSC